MNELDDELFDDDWDEDFDEPLIIGLRSKHLCKKCGNEPAIEGQKRCLKCVQQEKGRRTGLQAKAFQKDFSCH